MSDHPHGDAIQLLYAADEDHPSAALVLDDQGRRSGSRPAGRRTRSGHSSG